MNLGENIYRLRTQKQMSQDDLAEALHVSRQSVSKWENGASVPELEKLVNMSQLFGVSLDELVGSAFPAPAAREPEPPQPAPASQGITTNDLVSTLVLLFAILIPVIILATARNHNSSLLMALGLFIIPPGATICAALCSPNNTLLFRVYMVYDTVIGVVALIAANVLSPLILIVYIFAVGFWNDRRK